MRVIGLDLGERRVGVAVSDSGGRMAVGHGTVERTADADADRRAIVDIVRELDAEHVVVGLPLSLDGTHGAAAQRAQAEAASLADALAIPVDLVDERFTTVAANRSLATAGVSSRGRRKVVDEVAATILLQTWLDGRPNASSGPESERT